MSIAKFVYTRLDGSQSGLVGLVKVLRAAGKALKSGAGPFVLVRDQFKHTNLQRFEALKILRAILDGGGKGTEVRIHDRKGDVVFHVKRVPTSIYDDPFRDATYSSARIDAGVDYCGNGKVYAIGPGVIVNVGTPSHDATFGNNMAVYRLTEGPGKGLYVFFAEHYNNVPKLRKGMKVDSQTVLYKMNGCIEIGWSDGVGSEAWNSGNYQEGQRSALGDNFSKLLVALGAKPGLKLGRPITGSLPAKYPRKWRGKV